MCGLALSNFLQQASRVIPTLIKVQNMYAIGGLGALNTSPGFIAIIFGMCELRNVVVVKVQQVKNRENDVLVWVWN